MKILIFENDHTARVYLESTIKGLGFEVCSASDGAAAFNIARQDIPDLIVSTVFGSGTDGFEFCRRIKHDEKLKSIPFVFHASHASQKDERFALSLGASYFIHQSDQSVQLVKALEEVIAKTRASLRPEAGRASGDTTSDSISNNELIHLNSWFERRVAELEHEKHEIRQSKHAARRLNRILATLIESHRVLTNSTTEEALFSGICDLLVTIGGYRLAWVGMALNDPQKTVQPVAHSGFTDDYLDAVRISWANDEFGQGPTGSAIRSGESSIARDILNDERFEPWRDEALKRRYASSIALPLSVDDKIVGALNVYSPEVNAFDEAEVNLLTKLAEELTLGVNALHNKKERRKAQLERDLALQEQAMIMESVPGLIFKININGTQVSWNRRVEEVLGYSSEELYAMSAIDFFVESDQEKVVEAIKRAYIQGYTEIEVEHVTKHGQRIPYHYTGVPIWDDAGHITGLVGVGTDLSERRKAEREKLELQDQLQQAQKIQEIGLLTGGIAHDFNNILNSVLGFSSLALKYCEQGNRATLKEYLREIHAAGERAKELVSNMMAFSRKTVGKKESINAEKVSREMLDMLRVIIPASIELRISADSNIPLVDSEAVKLHQMLMNLVINSRDAMNGAGLIAINLSVFEGDQLCDSCHANFHGRYVRVAVSDTGSGIPPDVYERMFEPFFTTKDAGKGTGMGMPMVHSMVHSTGGHIQVEADTAIGTTISLFLPLSLEEQQTLSTVNPVAEKKQLVGQGRVLVVDDDQAGATLMGELLKCYGYEATVMTDSVAALKQFKLNPAEFDLLVTDQTMPVLSGIELHQAITTEHPDFPVIICSGYSDLINQDSAKGLGIDHFITKPVDPDQLLDTISSLLA